MKILLVRLDGIGDALACTPLVAALKGAGHQLGVALTQRNAAIFARDVFAWTHVLERRPWPAHGHAAGDVAATIERAAAIGYDVALVASEEPDAYVLAQRCAPERVGFINGWEKPFKSMLVRRRLTRAIVRPAALGRTAAHEVETLFALGDGLHDESEPTRDVARLRPLVVDGKGSEAQPAPLAVQLGAKWSAMRVERAQLGAWICALRARVPVRLLASGDEALEVGAVREHLGEAAETIDATLFDGEEGMRAWKRAIADAGALLTPDTGAAHVAGMTGTPCVDLFPDERNARVQMGRWSPWASPSALLIAGRDAPVVAAAWDLWNAGARS